jgi:adenylate kinase
MNRVCSLNLEHVSPAKLMRSEISRRAVRTAADEANAVASGRSPHFTRKPDAGVLTDDPATLLQVKVFDDRLAACAESLHAFPAGLGSSDSVVVHHRALGLVLEAGVLVA